MNRFNMGNVVTNGMQVLSVAGTTASHELNNMKQRKLGDATSGLNNLSKEEQTQIGQMNADSYRARINEWQEGKKSVDDVMGDSGQIEQPELQQEEDNLVDTMLKELNTEQASEIRTRTTNDINWLDKFLSANTTQDATSVINELVEKENK